MYSSYMVGGSGSDFLVMRAGRFLPYRLAGPGRVLDRGEISPWRRRRCIKEEDGYNFSAFCMGGCSSPGVGLTRASWLYEYGIALL